MTISVFGLSFRTAPVEIRERLALTGASLLAALDDMSRGSTSPSLDEVVILSTCNRLEVYGSAQESAGFANSVAEFLARLNDVALDDLLAHAYSASGDDAVCHLMRVACGLDSMILGETQILGQVSDAYEAAHNAGTAGPLLSRLFAQAIHAGKRARTESTISRHTTSVSHAAVRQILDSSADPASLRVLVVGAGESAVLAAGALERAGVRNLTFVNRTMEHAEEIAGAHGGRALTWFQLDEALSWADAVLCATGAPHTVISREDVEAVQRLRDGRLLTIVDIAVPRDVDDTVRELPGVRYHDIDDLQNVIDGNLELRRAVVPEVEKIVEEELLRFTEWHRGRQVLPVIKGLREWVHNVAQEELDQTLNRLPDADARTRQQVGRMVHQLVNRLLHGPTTRLRMQALEGNGHGYAYAVRELFGLPEIDALDVPCGADCPLFQAGQGVATPCDLHCILPDGALTWQ